MAVTTMRALSRPPACTPGCMLEQLRRRVHGQLFQFVQSGEKRRCASRLLEEHPMQPRVITVVVDRCPHEDPQRVVKPFWQAIGQPLGQQPGSGVDMRIHQRSQDRVLVRKVLV